MTIRDYLPPFFKKKYQELDEHPELRERYEKITDFLCLIKKMWIISDAHYQERIWVKHETSQIVDSYDDTIMYFVEDAEAVIEDKDEITMTDNQYNMLNKLYHMVDEYDMNKERPKNDKDIVNDPKWHKIREYAKLVYEELIQE